MKAILPLVLLVASALVGNCAAASLRDYQFRSEKSSRADRDLDPSVVDISIDKREVALNGDEKNFFEKNLIPLAAGLGGGVLLILIVTVSFLILCVCLYKRRKARTRHLRKSLLENGRTGPRYTQPSSTIPRERGVAEEMNRQRREKELQEKKKATDTVQYFLRNNQEYRLESDLSDLGSRMQKHWYKVKSAQEGNRVLLLTTTPVSQKCPLTLDSNTLKGMNKLVKELRKHPFLQPIMIIDYLGAQQHIVVVQPFQAEGSLKDTIYRATPSTDWSNKYSRRSRGIHVDKVRLYGRQILEAMQFLYDRGFPTLGHVQSGNIFVVNGVCLLGGFENTLLGYKTRLYKMCKERIDKLDIIMFGHLLFEMCCGYELTQICLSDADYQNVKKEECKEILHFIFDNDFSHSIAEIKQNEFFSVSLPQLDGFDPNTVETVHHRSIEHVLEKVRKGKPRQQKIPKQKPKDQDAVNPAPPTSMDTTPTPVAANETTPTAGEATPTGTDRGEDAIGGDLESATLTGDSTGDQSGDGKEGKRKGRFKISRGKKKKVSSGDGSPSATVAAEGEEGSDKTPISPLAQPA